MIKLINKTDGIISRPLCLKIKDHKRQRCQFFRADIRLEMAITTGWELTLKVKACLERKPEWRSEPGRD